MGREAIEKKIARIKEYVTILSGLSQDCINRMQRDKVYRGSVLYYLYMMADSCVTLAEMVIRQKQLRTPQSYAEAIDILGENDIIPGDFSHDFARIAGFRNFLAHDYERIDDQEICRVMLHRLPDVQRYLSFIEAKLS